MKTGDQAFRKKFIWKRSGINNDCSSYWFTWVNDENKKAAWFNKGNFVVHPAAERLLIFRSFCWCIKPKQLKSWNGIPKGQGLNTPIPEASANRLNTLCLNIRFRSGNGAIPAIVSLSAVQLTNTWTNCCGWTISPSLLTRTWKTMRLIIIRLPLRQAITAII